jgi:DNA-binding LytR/AlgR family response regulator
LDDELPGLTYLKMLCEQIPEIEIVKVFNDPEKLVAELRVLDFDLLITDVEMPGVDGLSLATQLKGKLVVFTTAYKDYAAAAFEIDAVDYITKPVTKERLQKAVHKSLEQLRNRAQAPLFVTMNTDKGKTLIYFDSILSIKVSSTDSRDKEVLFEDDSILILKNINFDSLMQYLPKEAFCRINKKEIVAFKAVHSYSHNEIVLKSRLKTGQSIRLSLSETYRSYFLKNIKT